ncbi:MAG: sigma-54 dependent transcriptional regulator [Stappiaceae bacterium]
MSEAVKGPVLFVDDDPAMRAALNQWLRLGNFEPIETTNVSEALVRLDRGFAGCVISDVRLPGEDGFALLSHIQQLDKEIPVIMITGHGDVPMAVQAMRAGAYDFIEKPFDPDVIAHVVRRAVDHRSVIVENRQLKERPSSESLLAGKLLGDSPPMQELRRKILHFAATDATVMIIGETGTGKELVARALHEHSSRHAAAFVAVNSAALPETMVEAELFGHEPGAFTGAMHQRIGRIESADNGTLLLDEILSMPSALQPKLLRVLQEKEIDRIGGTEPVSVNVRVISAANSDPRQAVAAGRLREDLLFRLNPIEIQIPPLRERTGDALLIFETMISRFASDYAMECPVLKSADEAFLTLYEWPGNVRELRNAAERFVLAGAFSETTLEKLVSSSGTDAQTHGVSSLRDMMDGYEAHLIKRALLRHGGSIVDVMSELDLPRRTLNEKMQRYGISRTQPLMDTE